MSRQHVYAVELVRKDPGSSRKEITTAELVAFSAEEALQRVKDAADITGNTSWRHESMSCLLVSAAIVEHDTPPKRSWLCRLFCR